MDHYPVAHNRLVQVDTRNQKLPKSPTYVVGTQALESTPIASHVELKAIRTKSLGTSVQYGMELSNTAS